MTRKGIRITSEIDAKDRGILESQLDELQIWDALNDVLKWSRLYVLITISCGLRSSPQGLFVSCHQACLPSSSQMFRAEFIGA